MKLCYSGISSEDAILRMAHMNCSKIIAWWQTYVLFPLAVNPLMLYIVFIEHMFCFLQILSHQDVMEESSVYYCKTPGASEYLHVTGKV